MTPAVFLGAILSLISLAGGQSTNPVEPLIVKRTPNFDISGKGLAPEWDNTEWLMLDKRKGVAEYTTRTKLMYSDSGIYVMFLCEDKKITATLQEDFSRLWTEDVIEIFFWPDERTPIYFEYELSPLNYELPILVPNLDDKFLGWRPWQYDGERKTRHATHILRSENGSVFAWTAEFFIPYALLDPLQNVPPKSGTQWRMNMYRVDYDYERTSWSWKPVKTNFHDYKSFGTIKFQ